MTSVQQARPTGETRWYAPARDITCFTPVAIRAALVKWPEDNNPYRSWAGAYSPTVDEDICKAAEALAAFCSEECIIEPKDYREALERCGLLELPRPVQMAIYASIADELLAAFWVSIRAATTKGEFGDFELIQYDPDELIAASQQIVWFIRMPPWRRKLWRFWDAFRNRLVRVLRG